LWALCSPAAPRPPPRATPTLPIAVDVDLHEYVLNITMPDGQPTLLVALNVAKDL